MNTADLGDIHTVSALFQVESVPGDSSTLTPADPSAVVLRVRAPDGTVATPTPVHDSLGVWHYDLTVTASGIWRYRWEGTGAAADNADGMFFVRPSRVVSG